jgi:hypothetical protein
MKHKPACGYRKYLDLETLVCSGGATFRLLASRNGCVAHDAVAETCL